MAVSCPRCGREYDVTLFEFGRTISCACGSRVGIAPQVRHVARDAERRFAADAMLGRLARWLRLLGFDCVYEAGFSDEAIARLAASDGRTLLTRDRRLPEEWWLPDVHVVSAQDVPQQLAEVIARFGLAPRVRVLTRCSRCNRGLVRVPRGDVAARVPPRALREHEEFSECRGCGRVYWEGSHAARIRAFVERLGAGHAPERGAARSGEA